MSGLARGEAVPALKIFPLSTFVAITRAQAISRSLTIILTGASKSGLYFGDEALAGQPIISCLSPEKKSSE
jgi:hypothetical protein